MKFFLITIIISTTLASVALIYYLIDFKKEIHYKNNKIKEIMRIIQASFIIFIFTFLLLSSVFCLWKAIEQFKYLIMY